MVKNPLANAGDTSSIPSRGNLTRRGTAKPEQLILAQEPVLSNKRSHCNEKPTHRN